MDQVVAVMFLEWPERTTMLLQLDPYNTNPLGVEWGEL